MEETFLRMSSSPTPSSRRNVLLFAGFAMLLVVMLQEEFNLVSNRLGLARGTLLGDGEADPMIGQISGVWAEPEETLEFDESGEETAEWIAKENNASTTTQKAARPSVDDDREKDDREKDDEADDVEPSVPTTLPVITDILPSRNSERTLASLWGECTNETLAKPEKINYGIHVIMTFYKGTYKKERFGELLIALRRNLKNPYVTAVHTLWEDRDPISYVNSTELEKKLIRVNFGVQPTYKDLFDYANLRLGRGAVAIVTNSDIYFDETLACVTPVTPDRKAFNATKQHLVYALSRHPSNPCVGRADYCESYTGSHDAFVFALPLPFKFSSRVDFTQNNIGAENVIIWEFRRLEGYVVRNPCHSVKCYHIHCTNERHYRMGTISRGKNRIGNIDRHGSIVPGRLKCGQTVY